MSIPGLRFVLVAVLATVAGPAPAAPLRFEVTLDDRLADAPLEGRLLIVLGKPGDPEPWRSIGQTGLGAAPVLGEDVRLRPGDAVMTRADVLVFPILSLDRLPRGKYQAQAVLDVSRDLKLIDASGNLFSESVAVSLDPARGGVIRLALSNRFAEPALPDETEHVRWVKLRSQKLSRFHGRPVFLRAGVILPRDYDPDGHRRYPLRVHIGGYGTRFTEAASWMAEDAPFRKAWLADKTPRMALLFLDGAGPNGDPYQVNSDNNGPYGDALVEELIPWVEERFGCLGKGTARVLDGASTGGWVSLALQVFYPDFFNGAWAFAPDPVDFRAFELIDLYEDDNAYVNAHGFERPAKRSREGDVVYTVRHEVLLERVLGRGGRWELSGRDWCAWNAVFGPRGVDGRPRPLWDGATGKLDREVLGHWKRYDLRLRLARDWKALGPRLDGKLHVRAGDADEYFLNNAVHLLDDFLRDAKPRHGGTITFGPGEGHDWRGLTDAELLQAMGRRVGAGH